MSKPDERHVANATRHLLANASLPIIAEMLCIARGASIAVIQVRHDPGSRPFSAAAEVATTYDNRSASELQCLQAMRLALESALAECRKALDRHCAANDPFQCPDCGGKDLRVEMRCVDCRRDMS